MTYRSAVTASGRPPLCVDLALARRRPDGTVVVAIVAEASDLTLSPEMAANNDGALVKALTSHTS